MPYVIYSPLHEKYLRRVGVSRRKWVGDLADATVWMRPGHAKLAAGHAWECRLLPMTAMLDIVEIKLQEVARETVERQRTKTGARVVTTTARTKLLAAPRPSRRRARPRR